MSGWWRPLRCRWKDVFSDDMAAGEFSRTASRLTEMQTLHYLKQLHHSQRVRLNGDALM